MKQAHLTPSMKISMRKLDKKNLEKENFRDLEWFRPPGVIVEDISGAARGIYKINKELKLLNIGSEEVRKTILNTTSLDRLDLEPDEQYSSRDSNRKVHKAIEESSYFDSYDGTIITEPLIDNDLLYDLEGAEEIVLFTKRAKDSISLVTIEG